VSQAAALWEPKIYVAPDVVHGGAPLPGLAGRVYLFGAQDQLPHAGDGTLTVMLYNDDARGADGQGALQEYWQLTPDKLKLFLRKDIIGWGYTVFLPMSTYNPAQTHVHLMTCYQPKEGTPLYSPSGPIALQGADAARPVVQQATFTPGVQQRPAMGSNPVGSGQWAVGSSSGVTPPPAPQTTAPPPPALAPAWPPAARQTTAPPPLVAPSPYALPGPAPLPPPAAPVQAQVLTPPAAPVQAQVLTPPAPAAQAQVLPPPAAPVQTPVVSPPAAPPSNGTGGRWVWCPN
jgi:hypothetical protein